MPLTGYEICGLETLPGAPDVLVYYHESMAADYCFFIYRLSRLTGRFCYSILDHFLCHLPGTKIHPVILVIRVILTRK